MSSVGPKVGEKQLIVALLLLYVVKWALYLAGYPIRIPYLDDFFLFLGESTMTLLREINHSLLDGFFGNF
mgnify:FL=1